MIRIANVALYLLLLSATLPLWAKDYVLCDQYCGVVNEQGKASFDRVFDQLKPFLGEYALFKNEGQPWGLVDRTGQTRYQFTSTGNDAEPEAWFAGTWLSKISNDRLTLHAPDGEILLSDVSPITRRTDWSMAGSLPYVFKAVRDVGSEHYEIYDMQGQLKLKLASRPEYTSQNIMPAQDYATGLWGYLDRDFNWIVSPRYTQACEFIAGSAAVKNNTGWNLINQQTKRLNAFEFVDQYDEKGACYRFEKASFGVRSVSNQRYYLQYRDGRAIQLPLGTMLSPFSDQHSELIEVYQKGKEVNYGVVRFNGTWVIPLGKLYFSIIGPNSIRFKDQHSQYGLLDGRGEIIAAAQYQYIQPLGNNPDLFIVTQNQLQGVLSRQLGLIIPIQYSDINAARPGMMFAKDPKTKQYLLFTEAGRELDFPPVEFMQGTMPDGARRIVLLDKREGFVNAAGQFELEAKPQPNEAPTEFDEFGLAAVGDTLLNPQGEEIATFASVWPQYQYESNFMLYGHEFELDPCIIEHPSAYSVGQGERKPTWCQQPALRAAVTKTLTTFHQRMTAQNASSLGRLKQQFATEIAAADADVLALAQHWQARLNARKARPLYAIKKRRGTVPQSLQRRLMGLIPDAESEFAAAQADFNQWYWSDLNADGQREVIFSTPIDGGRATLFYIFAKKHSAGWQLIAQPYSFDPAILLAAKPGRWPELATFYMHHDSGQNELWAYSQGKYSVARSCSVHMGDDVDMLTFCPEGVNNSGTQE